MGTVREETTNSFFLIPSANVVFNVLLACLLSLKTKRDETGVLHHQAEQMLGLLTSTSIGMSTLTFSLTVLSIQIAAQAYSPRLLDEFLRDSVSKIALAVNLGAFSYGYTLTYFLRDAQNVPHVAIHFLSVHMLCVLLMFVYFVHYFINGFRLESILHRAAEDSWRAAQALESLNASAEVQEFDELPRVPSTAFKVMADHSGYVARYHLQKILRKADKLDLCIRYHPNIGEYVAEGTLLAYVWDTQSDDEHSDSSEATVERKKARKSFKTRVILNHCKQRLHSRLFGSLISEKFYVGPFRHGKRATTMAERLTEERLGWLVRCGVEILAVRSGQLDVLLGVQTMTDVAVKALSAAVNDPMTAVQALDNLSTLFGRLAHLTLAIGVARDSTGVIRVSAPRRSFAYVLSIVDAIRFYGASDLTVSYRLMRFYGDLGAILKRLNKTYRIPAVLAQMEQCMVVARKNFSANSMEFRSIEVVYQYSMDLMAASDEPCLQENEALEMDLSYLETTYARPSDAFVDTLPKVLKDVIASEQFRTENIYTA
jgi:uncharacterized membrane protein